MTKAKKFIESLEFKVAELERIAASLPQSQEPEMALLDTGGTAASLNGWINTTPSHVVTLNLTPSVDETQSATQDTIMGISPLGAYDANQHQHQHLEKFDLCRMVQAAVNLYRTSGTATRSELEDSDVPDSAFEQARVTEYLKSYLDHIHCLLPMFEERWIRSSMDLICDGNLLMRRSPILLLILALGAILPSRRDILSSHYAFSYIRAAMSHIPSILCTDDIEAMQSILLLTIISLYDPIGGSTWQLAGLAMRVGIVAGLHEEVSTSLNTNDLARNTFWVSYILDR